VDWNRHPHKTEIYLQNLGLWQDRLRETIATALTLPEDLTGAAYANQRVDRLLKTAEQDQGYRTIAPPPVSIIPVLKVIAQLHQMYIVAESPTGLCLIEQHIAHERVLYEQLCDRWQLEDLSPPLVLSQLKESQVEQLQRLGIDCDPFGEQQWIIRTAPAPLIPRSDCAEALMELSLGGDLDAAQVAVACRTAIRNGTPLDFSAMQDLLNQWQQTRNPHTCPHGRPICLKLEETSLSRFFRRHWVVGKSHGAFPPGS
jgi:DNA mismatch repair protein MutL